MGPGLANFSTYAGHHDFKGLKYPFQTEYNWPSVSSVSTAVDLTNRRLKILVGRGGYVIADVYCVVRPTKDTLY